MSSAHVSLSRQFLDDTLLDSEGSELNDYYLAAIKTKPKPLQHRGIGLIKQVTTHPSQSFDVLNERGSLPSLSLEVEVEPLEG